MKSVRYDLRLDAQAMGSQASVTVKRGDSRSRLLRVRLYAGSTPVVLGDGALAVLRGIKPDGTIFYNDCTVTGNAIEQMITDQMMAVPGAIACEMTIYEPEGAVLSTPCFDLYVEDLLISDGVIESTNEYTALTDAILRLANLEADVAENEQDREMAEAERGEAENERDGAETEREANEAQREENEGDRVTGEAQRQENEAGREVSEAARQANEDDRVASEAQRQTSEGQRQTNEAQRQTNEAGRAGAEAARVALYDEVKARYESGGFDGESGTVEIVETQTSAPGGAAALIERPESTAMNRRYTAVIPKGANGDLTRIQFGQVITGPPGSAASIVNVGTESDQVWDITLPRGQDGTGAGDMTTTVYDANGNGVVDNAEALGGVPAAEYALKTDVPAGVMERAVYDVNGNGIVDNAEALGGVPSAQYALKTDVPADALRYDTPQTLTPAQQAAIREKIGAGEDGFDGDYNSLTNKPTIPSTAAEVGAVPTGRTVNGKALAADITLNKTDVGLGNVDNTADAAKPISTAMQTALNGKSNTDHTHGQYLTAETDPSVPAWAKEPAKPAYTAAEVGAVPVTGGTVTGQLIVGNPAIGTVAVRNGSAGTADLTPGVSTLPTGTLYYVYE